ncbi:hypothetical protein B1756_16610 [Natrarchaeobaculum aegyptiacum]|uniref:Uncharacterized protein n=1 Tax=Natrarchaeobaculum aegyptiacum TaxID=745377 RepID=A0A2Z2HZ51_9EURY|nr:hypothetical protein B1756_16610 [Natrarchaeobaculum aegyptiacum]
MIESGNRVRHLRKEIHTTLKRLQERDAAEWRVDIRFDHFQNALTDIVEKASREAVEYAESFEDTVIVLEDLTYIRESLDYGQFVSQSSSSTRPTHRRRATSAATSGVTTVTISGARTTIATYRYSTLT